MRSWSASGRVKIERAEKHIRDFEAERDAFRALRPYRVVGEAHADCPDKGFRNGCISLTIRQYEPIPDRLPAIVADAVHNLRSALDHLWQRAVYGTRSAKRDYFPFFESPDSAKTRFKGKEKGRCKTAVDILKSVNAFEVGNPLWSICCFDDADKHDTLRLVASRIHVMLVIIDGSIASANISDHGESNAQVRLGFPPYDPTAPKPAPRPGSTFDILEHGKHIGTRPWTPGAPEPDVDDEIVFEIAFGEGEILEREAVLPTLKHFAATVRSLEELFIAAKLID